MRMSFTDVKAPISAFGHNKGNIDPELLQSHLGLG